MMGVAAGVQPSKRELDPAHFEKNIPVETVWPFSVLNTPQSSISISSALPTVTPWGRRDQDTLRNNYWATTFSSLHAIILTTFKTVHRRLLINFQPGVAAQANTMKGVLPWEPIGILIETKVITERLCRFVTCPDFEKANNWGRSVCLQLELRYFIQHKDQFSCPLLMLSIFTVLISSLLVSGESMKWHLPFFKTPNSRFNQSK